LVRISNTCNVDNKLIARCTKIDRQQQETMGFILVRASEE
jgi:hypothetical protein